MCFLIYDGPIWKLDMVYRAKYRCHNHKGVNYGGFTINLARTFWLTPFGLGLNTEKGT